jgi:uncharacterized protein
MSLKLLTAQVGHTRHQPKHNSFTYDVFYIAAEVTKDLFSPTPRFFSWNRFNIFSLYTRDHGAKTADDNWYQWITEEFRKGGVTLRDDDRITLICHPRLLGYAFNPISYWLLKNRSDELLAVLCEVNNTFGDSHNYLLSHPDGQSIILTDVFHAEKKLYVSPFNKMTGRYEFLFTATKDSFQSTILYYENEVFTLTTLMGCIYRDLTNKNILIALIRYPFMTLLVVFRIHWQAIKLYFKKVKHTLGLRPRNYTSGKTTFGKDSQEN